MRGVLRFVLALALVLVIAWIGGWWYVQSRMALGFRHVEAVARAAGWQISHGEISRGSSPLTARLSIANLKLVPPADAVSQGLAGAPQPELTLPEAGAHIDAGSPFILHLDLPLQSTLAVRAGPSFSVNFTSIDAAYRINRDAVFDPQRDPFRGGSFAASGFRLDSANTNFTLVSIATLTGATEIHHRAGNDATAFSLREQLGGFALSPIFVTIGHVPFNGRLKSLEVSLDLSGPVPPDLDGAARRMRAAMRAAGPSDPQAALQAAAPVVKAWAQGGGHGKFTLGLGLGPATAHATGGFSFDSNLQPNIDADVTADQLGQFLADIATAYPAFTGEISAITSGLQPYLVKTPGGAQQLKVHLRDRNQILTANGNKIADVPKLDWNNPGMAIH